jgi:Mg2+ and Co2+ transporter CorA
MKIEYNFGVNLLTSSIFLVLTIIFLSWLFSVREKAEWRVVESKVLKRISDRLLSLFSVIDFYFLGSDLTEGYQEKIDEIKETNIKEAERSRYRIVVEYYATHPVLLGELTADILERFSRESIMEIKELFMKEQDYFEHMISEYSKFLPSALVSSIMNIQDEIVRMMFCCDEIRIIAGVRKDWDLIQSQVNSAKANLREGIHKIAEEINELNKSGKGF